MKNSASAFFAIFCIAFFVLTSCRPTRKLVVNSGLKKKLRSEVFSSQFTGLVLYDPAIDEYLFDKNGDLYFTPASNTKILTSLACFETFSDSIPSFSYYEIGDTLIIEPLGDPTLLNPDFPAQPAFEKMQGKQVNVYFPKEQLLPFGPGWAWDDYEFSYQPQRSWFPLYGNQVRIFKEDSLHIVPRFFKHYLNVFKGEKPGNLVYRELKYNIFTIWMETDTSTFERKIPFDYSEDLLLQLLSDTLMQEVRRVGSLNVELRGILYNQSTINVLGQMMQRSDNFLAEQLLVGAALKSGYTNVNAFRQYLLSRWSFPDQVQWVDGSGLSRYNMLTPKLLIRALARIYKTQPWSTIETVFATGGHSGTLKDWYGGFPPYVFAKTGTLRNNHTLSGFIKTDSGKTLIFSFMNNHYTRSISEIKTEMQGILELIKKRY